MLPECLPEEINTLDAEWLTQVLREAGALAQGAVIAFRAEPLPAANGQLLRLTLYYDGDTTAPKSLIAKFSAADPAVRTFGREQGFNQGENQRENQGDNQREVYFYQKIAQKSRLYTPICYYAATHPQSGDSILLFEDLAPTRPLEGECSYAEAALAVQEIAKLHCHWWRNPRLDNMEWLPNLDRAYYLQLQSDLESVWASFLAKASHESLPLVRVADALCQHLPALARLGQEPQTIIHYDFHLGNVLFSAHAGEVPFAVVNWKSVRKGRSPQDVACFLGISVAADLRRREEGALLKLYHAALIEGWVARYSFEECFDDYRLAMLDCLARAIIEVGARPAHPSRTQKFRQYATAVLDLKAVELIL